MAPAFLVGSFVLAFLLGLGELFADIGLSARCFDRVFVVWMDGGVSAAGPREASTQLSAYVVGVVDACVPVCLVAGVFPVFELALDTGRHLLGIGPILVGALRAGAYRMVLRTVAQDFAAEVLGALP